MDNILTFAVPTERLVTPNTLFEFLAIIITVQLFKRYCDFLSLNEVDLYGTTLTRDPCRLVQKNVMRKEKI